MAIYHCSVGNAKSAMGSDAYIEGEKEKDKLTGKTYDYSGRNDVIYTETMLTENAPQEWQDSSKLWEAVAEAEKPDARQAKKIEVALPKEFDREEQIKMCQEYAQHFIDKGQCVTFAIHDKGDGNPHAHFLLSVREIDENGKFKPFKSKGVYDLDENGNRIPLIDKETGQQKLGKRNEKLWKRHKEEVIPCSSKEYLQECRQKWEDVMNEHLPENEKVSCKSYEAQGIKKVPTIHEGYGERAKENKEQNKLIKAYNQLVEEAKHLMTELKSAIREELFGNDGRERTGTINGNAGNERGEGRGDREPETDDQRKKFAHLRLRARTDQIQRQQEAGERLGSEQSRSDGLKERIRDVEERIQNKKRRIEPERDGSKHKGWSLGG